MDKCRLTGKTGKYVKSHIIPKALTRPSVPGNKFMQPDPLHDGKRLIRRSDSWYDKGIVIREGEDYLSDLDSFAIEQLRLHGLVWSSPKVKRATRGLSHDLAIVEFSDPGKVRRFFLSVLWRAAVSKLPEFREIEISGTIQERLRRVIIGEEKDTLSLFPITLVQLTTRGPAHNLSPFKQKLELTDDEILRLYMDGLVAHFHLNDPQSAILLNPVPYGHPMFVGSTKTLVTQIETSASFQMENLSKLVRESQDAGDCNKP